MTAIAAIEKDGIVYMAGDSAASCAYFLENIVSPKIFVRGEYIVGYTTSFRMGQLIEHTLKFPKPKKNKKISDMHFLVKKFIPALKACLRDHGFETSDSGEDRAGTFLLGFRGKLYRIQPDYSVIRSASLYNACGCGADLVLGSLFSTKDTNMAPRQRLTMALKAAEKFSTEVASPFHFLTLGKSLKSNYCEK
jgi:hypothetical protein